MRCFINVFLLFHLTQRFMNYFTTTNTMSLTSVVIVKKTEVMDKRAYAVSYEGCTVLSRKYAAYTTVCPNHIPVINSLCYDE